MVEHVDIPDGEIHEPKGITSATNGEVYVANGTSSGSWSKIITYGWEDYDNSGAAQALTLGVKTDLTNDGLGVNTNTSYALPSSTGIWDTVNNQFDFEAGGCEIGDSVNIRFDVDLVANTANDGFEIIIDVAHGSASEFELPVDFRNVDASGTESLVKDLLIYIGSSDVLTYPAKVTATAQTAGDSIQVNGWIATVFKRNPVFV